MCKHCQLIIIIVNFNGGDRLLQCVRSVFRHLRKLDFRIVVWDNNSTDSSVTRIRDACPEIIIRENAENLGFAAGNNGALALIRNMGITSDYFLFLNNDTEFTENGFFGVIDYMENNAGVVALGPAVFEGEKKFQVGAGGWHFSLTNMIIYYFFLNYLPFLKKRGINLNQNYFFRKNRVVKVDWLCGAALLVRSSAVQECEFFPEQYFMYAEDLALSDRLRTRGNLVYFPGFAINHYRSYSGSGIERYFSSLLRYLKTERKMGPLKLKSAVWVIYAGLQLRRCMYGLAGAISRRHDKKLKIVLNQLQALKKERSSSDFS